MLFNLALAARQGLNVLGLDKRPSEIAQQQALASIGQVELMSLYNHIFARYQQKSVAAFADK